ncbi:hypothetical protein [Moraxella oblonga]|uniref:hypothetical protein n=1 Tax=Moraxella oblonga TaxID=200413 RepID=UPI0008332C51|nr:hypothetical protein [Moraxella oblonga]
MAYYQEYEYRIPKGISIFTLLFFGLFSFYGIPKALNNDKPLTRRGVEILSAEMADWFWIISTIIMVGLTVLGLLMTIKSFQAPNYVIVEDEQITLPKKPISNQIVTLAYDEIHKLKLENVGKQHTLSLFTDDGKCVLSSQSFANIDEFNEVVEFVKSKVNL